MEVKKGKIVRIVRDRDTGRSRGFGFLRAEDRTEAFVHQRLYPSGMEMLVGDELECEIIEKDGKFQAVSVKVINRGDPSAAPVTQPSLAPSPPAPTSDPKSIGITWEKIGSPTRYNNEQVLPLTLKLAAPGNKQLPSNTEINLLSNGTKVTLPTANPSPDSNGRVEFLVPLSTSLIYALAATIKVNGEKVKTATHIWEKRQPKPAAKKPDPVTTNADTKLPDIEVVNPPRDPDPATGLFLVTVITRKQGVNTKRKFTVISSPEPVEVLQDTALGLAPVTEYTEYSTGIYRLFCRFTGIQVTIILRLDDMKETVVHLRK